MVSGNWPGEQGKGRLQAEGIARPMKAPGTLEEQNRDVELQPRFRGQEGGRDDREIGAVVWGALLCNMQWVSIPAGNGGHRDAMLDGLCVLCF